MPSAAGRRGEGHTFLRLTSIADSFRGCDIGRTTYAKYEAGELNVRVSVLLALKRLYGCPYDAFFAGLDTADDAEAR